MKVKYAMKVKSREYDMRETNVHESSMAMVKELSEFDIPVTDVTALLEEYWTENAMGFLRDAPKGRVHLLVTTTTDLETGVEKGFMMIGVHRDGEDYVVAGMKNLERILPAQQHLYN